MIGPSRPGTASEQPDAGSSGSHIGPALPPHLQRKPAEQESEDDEDDYGPALPPALAQRKVQGPARPFEATEANAGDDESSDDDAVGPLPPPGGPVAGPSLTAAEEFRLREQRRQEEEEEEKCRNQGKSKREEWMLVPPSSMDGMGYVDPTKIKARGFVQNTRRGGTADKASEEGRALWTETPQERAKRLEEEVLGKRKRAENAIKQETEAQKRDRIARETRDADMRDRVDKYNNAASRSASLVDQHQSKTAKEAKEAAERAAKKSKSKHRASSRSPSPPPPEFWDREKMMGFGGRMMDEGKRRDIIGSSSTNLQSKFGGGTFL